jgi:hypothetical protein
MGTGTGHRKQIHGASLSEHNTRHIVFTDCPGIKPKKENLRQAPDHSGDGRVLLLYAGRVISPAARGRQQMVPWCTASITISIFRDVSAEKPDLFRMGPLIMPFLQWGGMSISMADSGERSDYPIERKLFELG